MALLLTLLAAPGRADEPPAAKTPPAKAPPAATPEDQVRGKWVLYRNGPDGRYKTVKEHSGDHTVVTTYDPRGNAIQSHRSDYRIDAGGNVPVFRYGNRVVLIGPQAGVKDETESAYLFRIDGDRFYEVHGLLPGDAGQPSMIVWERLKEDSGDKPAP